MFRLPAFTPSTRPVTTASEGRAEIPVALIFDKNASISGSDSWKIKHIYNKHPLPASISAVYLALKVEAFKTTNVWSASASLQLIWELLLHHLFPHPASNIPFFLFLCCCLSHWATPSFLLTTRRAVRGCIDPQGFSNLWADMASCRFLVHNLSSCWATLTAFNRNVISIQSTISGSLLFLVRFLATTLIHMHATLKIVIWITRHTSMP